VTVSTPLLGGRYGGYLYAYPHKTAYRRLHPARPLSDVWAAEPPGSRFLYIHVPFCEMRCGYCNLFTRPRPPGELVEAWLRALRRQARIAADAIGSSPIGSFAIGGGTPTMLRLDQLEAVFDVASTMGWSAGTPASVEVSPRTATADRLALLADRGIERVSIGVESFDDDDLRALGRPQRTSTVRSALDHIRAAGVPRLNIDLIYGAPGTTVDTWVRSIETALLWAPEELYLYPLYRRPLTALGADTDTRDDDPRPALYAAARSLLYDRGYEQRSMRMFRRSDVTAPTTDYDCQDDGMVGLGCGARSYTRSLHYSTEYAISRSATDEIIDAYVVATDADHAVARHGVELDAGEQRRRFVVKSILRVDGLDQNAYRGRFGTPVTDDFPVLDALIEQRYLHDDGAVLRPTPLGLAWSDAIGPSFVSRRMRDRMTGLALR
jgi:coproporphyrinogen III oxidase-like Fe-S oxidoreductase